MTYILFICWVCSLFYVLIYAGGQQSLRDSWSTYYIGTHAVIMVVDSTDRNRIGLVKQELWKMLSNKVERDDEV